MRRRDLLASAGGLVSAAGLAGCLGGSAGTPTSAPPTGTPDPTDSGPHPVTPAETTFTVRDRACGRGHDSATIAFDDDAVSVEGIIGGRDTCDTARVAAARLREAVLTVIVEVVEEQHPEPVACAECLTDIEYAFSATLPGTDALRVHVVHRTAAGESTVVTADRP